MGYRMSGRFTHKGKVYRFRSWLTDDPEPEVRMAIKEVGVRRSTMLPGAEPASEEVQIEWYKDTLDILADGDELMEDTEEHPIVCQFCGKPVPNGQEKYHKDGVCHSNG